ncbi:ABC transporter [Sphingobium sp. C100]|uniref:ABC-F family ATP-binding cassette domain-containing protein n=1 Tax=Sphingobium sp. C100 TaxID=1207055 RepID=UPI0003D5BDC3|nr:ABC-F family ATP-binding cassette domain-containing protein [Sphingobium sp. C100]ETI63076.1 ABC transporter [Sphingobium sp. C100]
MPSLSLAHVAWSTPDGRPVLSDLSFDFPTERTGLVGRNGVGKTILLHLLSGSIEPGRGRVVRSGSVSTMRQIARVSPSETIADLMGIAAAVGLLRRAEAGTASLDEFAEADWTIEARAAEALARVGLEAPLHAHLVALSGGQRTRAALAGAVFAQPDFLLLDEPTNDLDRDGRRAVRELLESWTAGAIVVSHDRELLEVMDAIAELTTLGVVRYGGNWTAYRAQKAVELAASEQDLLAAKRRVSDAKHKAQQTAERQQRRDAAGARKGARGDMPRILAGARRNRAENSRGDAARLADRQRAEADQSAMVARSRVEHLEPLTIALPSTGLSSSQRILQANDLSFDHAPSETLLEKLNFTLTGPERVAITGINGSGKSTLLALLAGDLVPHRGTARIFVPFAFFDQRMTILDPALSIGDNFARTNPQMDENARRASLARFQFRAAAADRIVGTLSGGQTLRAALACVLGSNQPPPLLILDEPTNHLDLDSISAVEAGLHGYDGALIVVSHDERFLDTIGITRTIGL